MTGGSMTGEAIKEAEEGPTSDARIRAEQIRVFHAQANTALVGNLLAVLATVALLWDRVDQLSIMIWAGVTGALVILRLLIYRGFDPASGDIDTITRWGRRFTLFAFFSGLCWGALPGVFFETTDPFVPIYIVCVVAGLLVGALGALSAHGPAYRAYVVAMVTPLILRCLVSGATDYMIIGGLVAFALLTSIRFGAVWESILRDQIRHRLDAEKLLSAAEMAKGALSESEQRLGAILEASPIGVSVLSAWSGRRVFVNKALMDQFGADNADELTNARVEDSWVNQRDYQYALDKATSAEPLTNFVAPRRRLDGGVWWALHNNVQLIFEGEPARVIWHTDVTQSKQAEEEIRASEARLRGLLESSPIGVGVLDRAGTILFANSRYAEILGLDEAEMLGLNAATLIADPARHAEILAELSAHGGFSDALVELRRSDGKTFWGLISCEMIDFQGQRAILTWTYDIDERVRMESVLQAAKDEAEAANRAKSNFLAAMSHEIRTPMNGVLGMIEILQQSSLSEDQRSITGTIQESAVGLLTIIDDILDFSKIEASRLELEAVPVHLRAILESVLDIVGPELERKRLDLALLVDDAVPEAILGDPTRLRQVLLNLIGNAVKFTEAGWIEISVSVAREERGDGVQAGDRLRVTIKDTGIGISPERQAGLFEAFSQAETSTTRRFGGTGLGLSISARLVRLMDGEIGVESLEGTGATFWFTLPIEPVAVAGISAVPELDLSGHAVLVVEPIEPVRRMLAALLASSGAEVVAPDIVAEAVAQAERRAGEGVGFDVLLVDTDWGAGEMGRLAWHFDVPDRALGDRALGDHAQVNHAAGDQTARDRAIIVCPGAASTAAAAARLEIFRPVRRAPLLRAVAAAVGRSQSEMPVEMETSAGDIVAAPSVEEALAQGRLILVAEDNATNREVVLRQLNLLGYAAEVAEDGAVAFDMWSRRAYGLLVTDCHMPNKDGFELTWMVRDVERELGTHTPIIALTANALAGEAERCLNAGMDDYLSKPVGLRKLRETLARWLPATPEAALDLEGFVTPSARADHEGGARTGASGPLDLSVLGELFGEDKDGMREMMELFLSNADRLVAEIDAAIDAGDAAAIARAGHGLKGAANAIGVTLVGDVALAIEAFEQGGDKASLAGHREDLDTALEEARRFIQAF